MSLAGQFWLDLMRLQPRLQQGLQASEGLPEAGGSASKSARSHGWQVGAGGCCWKCRG